MSTFPFVLRNRVRLRPAGVVARSCPLAGQSSPWIMRWERSLDCFVEKSFDYFLKKSFGLFPGALPIPGIFQHVRFPRHFQVPGDVEGVGVKGVFEILAQNSCKYTCWREHHYYIWIWTQNVRTSLTPTLFIIPRQAWNSGNHYYYYHYY